MKKNITIGIFLIVIAVLMVVSKLGLLQNLPVFKILFTVILGIIAIKGIFNFKFAEIFIPLALIGCIFDRELGITAITPWILIIASILISIGLDMIFKDFRYKIKMNGNKESSFSENLQVVMYILTMHLLQENQQISMSITVLGRQHYIFHLIGN